LRRRHWKQDTEARLDTLVGLLEAQGFDEPQLAWLRSRWRAAILNMLSSAIPEGRHYRQSQVIVLFGGLAVPVLASFNAAYASPTAGVRYAVLVVSLVVALAAALQQAYSFRENWQLNWRTAGALEAEAWSYLHGVAPVYADKTRDEQTAIFVDRIEQLIVEWNHRSITAAVAAPPTAAPTSAAS
jgi:hypothetical protein